MNLGAGQPASLPYGVEPPSWYSNQYPYHSVQFSSPPQQWDLPFFSPVYHPPPPSYHPPPPPSHHLPPPPNPYPTSTYHPYQQSYPPTVHHFIPTNQFVPPHTTHEPPPPIAYPRQAEPDLQPCSIPLQIDSEVPIIESRCCEFNFSDAKVSEFLESVSRLWDTCISKCMKGIQSSEGSPLSLPPPTHTPKIQSSEPKICSPLPSHLGDAQSLSVANNSMSRIKRASSKSIPATGGVTKRKYLKRNKLLMSKPSLKTPIVPSLLSSTVSAQVNNTHASFNSVSDTGTLSFVNNGCGDVDYVFVVSIPVDVSVRQDIPGPNLGENGRECHALHLLDEMPQSKGLCSVGGTVATPTSIRDKGGGLAHQPVEVTFGASYEEEDEYFDKFVGRDDEVDDGHAISKLALSTQLIRNDKLTVVSREKVHNDGMVISGLSHVNEIMITGEARVICRRFGENVLGDVIEKVLVFDRVVNLSGCLATKDNCNPAKLESNDNSVEQEVEIVTMGGSKVQQQFVSEPISSVPINYDMCVCSMMIVIWPKKICHYVLLPCSSGFDKKVSDKGSGRSLLTRDLLVLDKESTGMWLWVSLSIWIATIRPLWKPGNAYTKVFSSSTNFGFRALDVVETIVKSQSCWEEFCLRIDGISEKAAQVVHELSSSSKKVRVLHFYSNTTGNERTFAQATVLEHPSSFEVILLVSNKSGNSSKRIFTLIISLIELWKYGYVEKNMRWLTKISVTSFGKECLKYYHGQGLIFSAIKLETLSFYSTYKFDKMEEDVTMRWKSTIIAANDYCTEELREIFLENHMK
ncbi:hypothetical protein ACLB2K_046592 [Fragaria x ananassa]